MWLIKGYDDRRFISVAIVNIYPVVSELSLLEPCCSVIVCLLPKDRWQKFETNSQNFTVAQKEAHQQAHCLECW